jgi:hypothetical protein
MCSQNHTLISERDCICAARRRPAMAIMRDSIVDKLRTILAGAVDDECKVMYVLAEARKLLEKYIRWTRLHLHSNFIATGRCTSTFRIR